MPQKTPIPSKSTQRPTDRARPAVNGTSRRRQEALAASARLRARHRRWVVVGVISTVALVAILFAILHASDGSSVGTSSSAYPYQVGQPGPAALAPEFKLASTAGGSFDLGTARGKTVLLFFQEGLTCEPCWTQLKDLDSDMTQLRTLGIDEVVSITTNPIDQLVQKVSDEGITSPVLSDPNLSVSSMYQANQYGMMGTSGDGHTFIVVGPDGHIRWRADYGGAPNYTMDVPMSVLLQQLGAGLSS